MKLDSIQHFISFNKRISKDGQSTIVSVTIPEMNDEQIIQEIKATCILMVKARNMLNTKADKVNKLLAATTGRRKQVTPEDAERAYEKGFGILVKLVFEANVRGLSDKVRKDVCDAVERTSKVDITLDDDDLLMLAQ